MKKENIPINIDKNVIDRLAKKHGLSLVVLFGSQASGKIHPGSDTDIAFLSRKPKNLREVCEIHAEFANKLRVQDIKLDLVDLRGRPPLFLKQVALKGIPLYERRPSEFSIFKIYALNRYFEIKPLLKLRELSLNKFFQTI
jgi:predicted nucleotidyltransferase